MADEPVLLEPGSKIGRYELIRRLETGGMAEIYLARVTGIEGFEKRVVVKRILPHLAANDEFVAMFLDEARIAATLEHPNIAGVHDVGQDADGGYYMAMEYVDGRDLRHIRKALLAHDLELPLEHAVGIILGAAAGLHSAHMARRSDGRPMGIVHRDVSPANILVTWEGCIKVIDFGIAKAAYRVTQTHAGVLKGKSSYMSPEQCLGERIDHRSDIFSLGILLYELTTRSGLFRGKTAYETMNKIANVELEPPCLRAPGYPKGLERIVMRALQKRPRDRYPTAQEMIVDLERFARTERLPVSQVAIGAFLEKLFPEEGPSAVAERAPTVAFQRRGPTLRAVTDTGSGELLEEVANEASGKSGGAGEARSRSKERPTVELRAVERPASEETLDLPRPPLPLPAEPADAAEASQPCRAMVLARPPGGPGAAIEDSRVEVLPADHDLESEALTSMIARPRLRTYRPRRPIAVLVLAALSGAALVVAALVLMPMLRGGAAEGADDPPAATAAEPAAEDEGDVVEPAIVPVSEAELELGVKPEPAVKPEPEPTATPEPTAKPARRARAKTSARPEAKPRPRPRRQPPPVNAAPEPAKANAKAAPEPKTAKPEPEPEPEPEPKAAKPAPEPKSEPEPEPEPEGPEPGNAQPEHTPAKVPARIDP